MLTLSHVSKSYGKFPAVEDISLEMEHGLYGMLAPNGAGKTTLIKMIATLLVPTQGEILWDGIPVAKLGEKYRDLLGYLPQQFGYYKNNTPVQYLDYLAALKNMPKQTAKEKIEQLLELVGLSDVADKKMKKFSGGMIQRVGIAQAMLNDPKILILDEPTAGLDPKERARFRNILSTLSKDRIVILSTHIVSDIESNANQVILLKERKLYRMDTVSNICKTLDGKVYECVMEDRAFDAFQDTHLILSVRQEQEHMQVRYYSSKPEEGSRNCTQDGLFLFPCIYVFLVSGKQHLRHLFPVPHIRSGILRMFQKLSVERFGQGRLFISKHSRNQACHCIDNHHGCQLAARQYIITDGNVICDHFLKHALINALVMPA